MKNRIQTMVVGGLVALLLSCPAVWAQDFQSTSTMRGSGSKYTPQVTPVGATSPISGATTTYDVTSTNAVGQRRVGPSEPGEGDQGSPVGTPLVMVVFAAAACGIVYMRQRKRAKEQSAE